MQRILPIMVVALLWLTACAGEMPISPPDADAPAQVEVSEDAAVAEEAAVEEAVAEEVEAEEVVAEEAVAEEAVAEEAAAEEVVAEEVVAEDTASDSDAPAALADVSVGSDIGPPPEFSPALRASDPTQFVRANGKPQVLEFFAFW